MISDQEYQLEWLTLSNKELWVYNKLELSKILGYKCGPVGIDVPAPGYYIVRPPINFIGLGLGAQKLWIEKETTNLTPGHFWCEWFEGQHFSVDYEFGKWVRTSTGKQYEKDMTKWEKWYTLQFNISFPGILSDFKHKPNINCEFIGNKLIEVHIRKNPDFLYNNSIFIPVWEGELISPPDGFRYVECPDVNGRIGAYVDST